MDRFNYQKWVNKEIDIPKIFTGTQAAWDALSAEEKAKYDGKIVNIIDDCNAGGTLYADLPIGSWVKNDSDTIPSGFLKAGDTISQTLYPELYAKYGSTVPYKADTSELDDYENITFPASLQVTAQYDGVIIATAYDNGYLTLIINNNRVYIRTQSSGINAGTATVPIRKGDAIGIEGADGGYVIKVRYYKKSLIVKAKQVAVPADFMDAVDDVVDESKPIEVTATLDFNAYGNALVTPPNGYKVISAIMPDHNWAFDVFYDNGKPYVHSRGMTDYSAKITGAATLRLVYIKI